MSGMPRLAPGTMTDAASVVLAHAGAATVEFEHPIAEPISPGPGSVVPCGPVTDT